MQEIFNIERANFLFASVAKLTLAFMLDFFFNLIFFYTMAPYADRSRSKRCNKMWRLGVANFF